MSTVVKTPIADVLGGLLADKADIGTEIEATKAVLIGIAANGGSRTLEGELFRTTVSFGSKRVVDYKAILAVLLRDGFVNQDLLDHLLASHTQVAEGVPTVKCSARKAA